MEAPRSLGSFHSKRSVGAGSGCSFPGRHTSLVCQLGPSALIPRATMIGQLDSTHPDSHTIVWGHLRTTKSLLSTFCKHWRTPLSRMLRHLWPPAQPQASTARVSFQKTQQCANNKRDIPRNLWTRMAVFLETGSQKRKEEETRSAARCHGVSALPGDSCFQEGREPWVAGDLPGREHLPGVEGKLESAHRNTDRLANKAFTQLYRGNLRPWLCDLR